MLFIDILCNCRYPCEDGMLGTAVCYSLTCILPVDVCIRMACLGQPIGYSLTYFLPVAVGVRMACLGQPYAIH